jgi:hypothetical protein
MESLSFGLIIGIIAWLLGLLSSPITSRILKGYRRNEIKLLVKSDLENLKDRLEGICTSIDLRFGSCDKNSFERMKSTLEKSKEFFPDKPLKSSDITYEQYKTAMNLVEKNPSSFLNVKQFSLPLVNTVLADLSVLDLSYQKSLLWILHRVNLLNDEISFSMSQAALTFNPDAMKQSGEAIRQNLNSSYIKIKDQAEDLASYISKCLSS